MRKAPGDENGSGRPALQSDRKVENDINNINRRNLEVDKYLASQTGASEVRWR